MSLQTARRMRSHNIFFSESTSKGEGEARREKGEGCPYGQHRGVEGHC